jgi:hypothetical protein
MYVPDGTTAIIIQGLYVAHMHGCGFSCLVSQCRYIGLDEIANEIEDPFGTDDNDLDLYVGGRGEREGKGREKRDCLRIHPVGCACACVYCAGCGHTQSHTCVLTLFVSFLSGTRSVSSWSKLRGSWCRRVSLERQGSRERSLGMIWLCLKRGGGGAPGAAAGAAWQGAVERAVALEAVGCLVAVLGRGREETAGQRHWKW